MDFNGTWSLFCRPLIETPRFLGFWCQLLDLGPGSCWTLVLDRSWSNEFLWRLGHGHGRPQGEFNRPPPSCWPRPLLPPPPPKVALEDIGILETQKMWWVWWFQWHKSGVGYWNGIHHDSSCKTSNHTCRYFWYQARCRSSSSPRPSSSSSMERPSLIMRWIRPANWVGSSRLKPDVRSEVSNSSQIKSFTVLSDLSAAAFFLGRSGQCQSCHVKHISVMSLL